LLGGVAAYHLFPILSAANMTPLRKAGIENGRKVLELAMRTKGASMFIAGDLSLADLYLAPITFYVSLTSDKDAVFDIPGFARMVGESPGVTQLYKYTTKSWVNLSFIGYCARRIIAEFLIRRGIFRYLRLQSVNQACHL